MTSGNEGAWSRRSWLLAGASAVAYAQTTNQSLRPSGKVLTKHRNLFNGDSCVYFYNPELWQPEGGPYSAKAIHRYVDLLADSGVDTFLINPNAQVAWYPSKKLQTVLTGYKRGDREFFRGHGIATGTPPDQMDAFLERMEKFFNLYQDLIDAGVDWLAETSKACRRRGVSPWVSVRMNDMHGAANPKGSHFNAALFKEEKYRLSGRPFDPAEKLRQGWAGLNYEHAEVRDFMMSHIREYLEIYDFEGMELDWLRNPLCCEPPAGQKVQDLMTSWIGQVRRHTEARSRRLRKPVPLGLRIPANLGYLKSIGLDVARIAREGLIDFLGFSNFWQTTWDMPYDELRDQVGPHVAFYGVVEDAPNWLHADVPPNSSSGANGVRYLSASAPLIWANAAGKLAMGVQGIEQFNFFCTDQPHIDGLRADYSALKAVGTLDALRGKPKHYCLQSPPGVGKGDCCAGSALFESPEPIPVSIDPQARREFRLSMCAEPPGTKLTVQVVTRAGQGERRLGVSVNGSWPSFEKHATRNLLFPVGLYKQHVPEHEAYNFEFDASHVREGWNRVVVLNNERRQNGAAGTVRILSLELAVRSGESARSLV